MELGRIMVGDSWSGGYCSSSEKLKRDSFTKIVQLFLGIENYTLLVHQILASTNGLLPLSFSGTVRLPHTFLVSAILGLRPLRIDIGFTRLKRIDALEFRSINQVSAVIFFLFGYFRV